MDHAQAIIIISLSTLLFAQVLKFIIAAIVNKRVDERILISTGGMPSSHSALVTSLMTAIALFEGIGIAFSVALVLALVVVHDSFGIRYEASKHAKELNQIKFRLNLIENIEAEEKKLKEALGHRPREVAAGIVLGVLCACFGFMLYTIFS